MHLVSFLRRSSHFYAWIIALAIYTQPANKISAQEPLLRPNDRIAILGGTLVERMQSSGAIEAEIQSRRPDWKLTFRNLGWSGDDVHGLARKVFDNPEAGFARILRDIETANPTVVLVAYGFAEASDGSVAVDRFETGLNRLLDELAKQQRRVILLSPFAMPGILSPGYDQSMSRCQQIVASVGKSRKTPVIITNWVPQADELTEDQLHPNTQGFASLAKPLADQLVGGKSVLRTSVSLRDRIASKNQLFFHRYRPQNETYLFLFRKHEQGNNASEIPEFDPLITAADQQIWAAAAGR
jgi:lysophospholipase L1-like esterase